MPEATAATPVSAAGKKRSRAAQVEEEVEKVI